MAFFFSFILKTIFIKRNVLTISLVALAFPLLCFLSWGTAFSSFIALWLPHKLSQWEAQAEDGEWEEGRSQGVPPPLFSVLSGFSGSSYFYSMISVAVK